MLKSYWHNGENPNIFFYRDTDQKEMILSLKNMTLYPIEVKKTANPNQSDSKNFNTLSVLKKTIGTGAIVCLYERAISIPNQNVVITPVWEI